MLVYTLSTVSQSLERVFQDYRIKKSGFNEWEKSVRAGDGFQEDMPRERQSNKGIFQERNISDSWNFYNLLCLFTKRVVRGGE